MTFSAGDSTRLSKTKRRKSAGDVMKSFSLPSLDSKDDSPSKRDQAMSPVHQAEEQCGPIIGPATSLRREGSWTRLCRRLSGKVFKNRPQGSEEASGLDQSFSVATGLFRILEQEVPASCGQPLTAGLEPI
ncbi:uncharacterized protein FOMMEDRAFT_144511 [Fomitiporia mediterranea MF3/22]|uniref:uncharacterized protein n=1 Tax=Fomitiporia mediterranea (strain MF3/22) TaxID=694068 RepID=UPI0004408B9E|nr:uncharacterized protein FOMMEDRAFT_144511 [Fomitiporia mediterranea MF3/22]EJD06484.1 hypothetical protein FOMMEDRAFT_144511 [Fomitiporia mediterranea MF3/22]